MTESYPLKPLVIIPTYSERDTIGNLISAILSLQDNLGILIVNDASPDDTAGAVGNLQNKGFSGRLFLSSRPGKLGLGNA